MRNQILYLNIGIGSETFFNWRNPAATITFNQIDVLNARNYPGKLSYSIHIKKQDYKLVFRKIDPPKGKGKTLIFIVGATPACQYQVMEAFMEFISEQWYEVYSELFLQSSTFGNLFEGFKEIVEDAFKEVPKRYLIKMTTRCSSCAQNFVLYVKKSLIDHAESFPVALVFEHADHALLLYIDSQGHTRGESTVDITG
ncbi:MAG: hypothetical protein RBG13Loki_2389 [Promethearchaeota archaeon CR_4]|nr:MAG: hypothetical protein RBG13Loki_2389 [Candidatus Lokiarchaeota archaeon CR_4]